MQTEGSLIIKSRWCTLEIEPIEYDKQVCITSESPETTHTYYLNELQTKVLIELLQEHLNKIKSQS